MDNYVDKLITSKMIKSCPSSPTSRINLLFSKKSIYLSKPKSHAGTPYPMHVPSSENNKNNPTQLASIRNCPSRGIRANIHYVPPRHIAHIFIYHPKPRINSALKIQATIKRLNIIRDEISKPIPRRSNINSMRYPVGVSVLKEIIRNDKMCVNENVLQVLKAPRISFAINEPKYTIKTDIACLKNKFFDIESSGEFDHKLYLKEKL